METEDRSMLLRTAGREAEVVTLREITRPTHEGDEASYWVSTEHIGFKIVQTVNTSPDNPDAWELVKAMAEGMLEYLEGRG